MPRASSDVDFSALFNTILASTPKLDPRRVGFMDAAMQGDAQNAALMMQEANNEASAKMQRQELAASKWRLEQELKQRQKEARALGRSRVGDRAGAIAGAVDAAAGLQSSGGQLLRDFQSYLKGQPSISGIGTAHLENMNATHAQVAPWMQPGQAIQGSVVDPDLWRLPNMPRLSSS